MTDTTDIKALREAATKYTKSLEAHIKTPLDPDLVRDMDSAFWELTDLIGNNELSIVINLLDQLEAERQRADHNKVMQLAAEDVSASALRDWSSEGIKLHAANEEIKRLKAAIEAAGGGVDE